MWEQSHRPYTIVETSQPHEWSNDVAQKVQTLYVDDIDGSDAAGTVHFGLDGTEYEIDLNSAHGEALRNVLRTYIDHGRKSGGARRATRSRRNTGTIDTTTVRAWAKEQGIDIKERGRVPANIVEQYQAAIAR